MTLVSAKQYPGRLADVLPENYALRSFNVEDGQFFSIDDRGRSVSLVDDAAALAAFGDG